MSLTGSAFILIVFLGFLGSSNSCEPPDCDRVDCGTCANSCCTLEFFLQYDTVSLNKAISSLLSIGGPDLHYTFVASEDLRKYNISAHFIIQGIHTTFVQKYNDTINLTIFPLSNKSYYQSRLRAFSISDIHGAYCDDGQNYKNLVLLIKGLNNNYIENHIAGCLPKFNP